MRLVPRSHWNGANPTDRFFCCQMNPYEPFERGCAGKDFGWIFITRESLDGFLAGQPLTIKQRASSVVVPMGPVSVQSGPSGRLDEQRAAPAPKRRRRTTTSLADQDIPLIAEMHKLMQQGVATSVIAAAGMIVHKADGFGTDDSKVDRLRRRYGVAYPVADDT
jgi:hypothetical protein